MAGRVDEYPAVVRYILFPGRHHLVTAFQVEHLRGLLHQHPGAEIVWAITSADHGGTQRNPLPGFRRLGLIEAVVERESLPSRTHLITNRRPKPDFAHYVVEEIRTQTGGRLAMTPDNTLVACSTPAVRAEYEALGFSLDGVELGTDQPRPWDVVERIIAAGAGWAEDDDIARLMHPVAHAHYVRDALGEAICSIHSDPLIDSDDGDITATRDYATYRAAFEDNADRKVRDFAHLVRPGRIVDVGCATGQTIKLLSQRPDLFESDFYGVEVARPLYEICQQRKANGEFGDANVFFHQRNILLTELFEPGSVDTLITMALTHEVESYLGRGALREFAQRAAAMLKPGGVWINYDVVGPDGRSDEVVARFTETDGADIAPLDPPTPDGLRAMSSAARFRQFARDFRREESDGIVWSRLPDGRVRLSREALYEFLAKKDYIDSWLSEMHERFCFFTPGDWAAEVERAGLVADVDGIQNPWLIQNRFAPAATVTLSDGVTPDPWSWTNALIVATRP